MTARYGAVGRTAVLRGGPFDAQTRELTPADGWPRVIRVPEWADASSSTCVAIHEYRPGDELGPTAREYDHDRREALR
jgi:hypothetical protein